MQRGSNAQLGFHESSRRTAADNQVKATPTIPKSKAIVDLAIVLRDIIVVSSIVPGSGKFRRALNIADVEGFFRMIIRAGQSS
jgi:hypothetical protein